MSFALGNIVILRKSLVPRLHTSLQRSEVGEHTCRQVYFAASDTKLSQVTLNSHRNVLSQNALKLPCVTRVLVVLLCKHVFLTVQGDHQLPKAKCCLNFSRTWDAVLYIRAVKVFFFYNQKRHFFYLLSNKDAIIMTKLKQIKHKFWNIASCIWYLLCIFYVYVHSCAQRSLNNNNAHFIQLCITVCVPNKHGTKIHYIYVLKYTAQMKSACMHWSPSETSK